MFIASITELLTKKENRPRIIRAYYESVSFSATFSRTLELRVPFPRDHFTSPRILQIGSNNTNLLLSPVQKNSNHKYFISSYSSPSIAALYDNRATWDHCPVIPWISAWSDGGGQWLAMVRIGVRQVGVSVRSWWSFNIWFWLSHSVSW